MGLRHDVSMMTSSAAQQSRGRCGPSLWPDSSAHPGIGRPVRRQTGWALNPLRRGQVGYRYSLSDGSNGRGATVRDCRSLPGQTETPSGRRLRATHSFPLQGTRPPLRRGRHYCLCADSLQGQINRQRNRNSRCIIAAIAAHHRFTIATRDVGPFEAAEISVMNPWVR